MAKSEVPTLEVFSTEAINNHVSHKVWNNPITLFPPILGFVGIGILWVMEAPFLSGLMIATYILIGVGGISGVADLLFRRDDYRREYILDFNRKLAGQSEQMSKYLGEQFRELDLDLFEEMLTKLGHSHSNFKDVLGEKFTKGDFTYNRYLGVAEGVYVGALGKLQNLLTKHRASSAIDPGYIQNRLKDLEYDESPEANTDRESLNQRLELKTESEEDIRTITSEVEAALSGLADLSVQVSNVTDASKVRAFDDFQEMAKSLSETTHLLTNEKQL